MMSGAAAQYAGESIEPVVVMATGLDWKVVLIFFLVVIIVLETAALAVLACIKTSSKVEKLARIAPPENIREIPPVPPPPPPFVPEPPQQPQAPQQAAVGAEYNPDGTRRGQKILRHFFITNGGRCFHDKECSTLEIAVGKNRQIEIEPCSKCNPRIDVV